MKELCLVNFILSTLSISLLILQQFLAISINLFRLMTRVFFNLLINLRGKILVSSSCIKIFKSELTSIFYISTSLLLLIPYCKTCINLKSNFWLSFLKLYIKY